MISVPWLNDVPSTRSPSCDFNRVTVPSIGDRIVVLLKSSLALSSANPAWAAE